jgi:molybdenum cofactor cytidylyltransferase
MHDIEHAVIVLAAGSSKRLTYPKQLLMREDETLVHRVVRISLETKPARLLVVTGAYRNAILDATAGLPIEEVFNAHHETGMASSIALAAEKLHSFPGLILMLGCDQAALELHHLQHLLAGAKQNASGYAALQYPEKNRAGIPAVIPAHDLKQAQLIHADQGFRTLLHRKLPDIFLLNVPELQRDLDTFEDVQYAIKQKWLDEHQEQTNK